MGKVEDLTYTAAVDRLIELLMGVKRGIVYVGEDEGFLDSLVSGRLNGVLRQSYEDLKSSFPARLKGLFGCKPRYDVIIATTEELLKNKENLLKTKLPGSVDLFSYTGKSLTNMFFIDPSWDYFPLIDRIQVKYVWMGDKEGNSARVVKDVALTSSMFNDLLKKLDIGNVDDYYPDAIPSTQTRITPLTS